VGRLFSKLQNGEAIIINGKTILPSQVIGESRPGRKIVYSGDTRPCKTLEKESAGADLLIHDSTLAEDLKDWALETKHSTSKEAAQVAKNAKVKQLILTHISSRYSEKRDVLLYEAKKVFGNSRLAEELMEIEIQLCDK
jgi:ribonuclease Z